MTRAGLLHLLEIYLVLSVFATVAWCYPRARANAKVRKARQGYSAEALELAQVRREFDRIVATTWGADR